MFLLILFIISTGAAEGLPSNLGTTCTHRQANAQKIRSGLQNEKVPGVCRDEVRKQYEACQRAPSDDDTGNDVAKSGPSVRPAAKALYSKTQVSLTKNTAKAGDCEDARLSVRKVCGGLIKDLREALEQNTKSERAEVEALSPGPQKFAQENQIHQRYRETSLQLQDQRSATIEFTEISEKALSDNANCYADLATRDNYDMDRAQEVLASADGENPQAENDVKPTKVEAIDHPNGQPKDELVHATTNQVKSEVKMTAARTVTGAVLGETSMVARAVHSVVGRTAATAVGVGTAGLGIFLGSTTSTSSCDVFFANTLAADAAGCSGQVQQALSNLGD